MARIDRLIQAMITQNADSLRLQADAKPALHTGTESRAIVNSELTAEQVRALVAEIAPDSNKTAVAQGERTSFTYACDEQTVQVDMADARVAIRLAGSAPSVAAPAAASTGVGAPAHVEDLLRLMVERGASDLHMSSDCLPMLRIDGDMVAIESAGVLTADTISGLLERMAPPHNWQQFCDEHDSDFAYEIDGLCRFRCNLFSDRKGPGLVVRAIPNQILTVDELNISHEVRALCDLTKGLVLVTGPTGSGKSTTLTSLIDLINHKRTDHILTIEDPIEFVHENKNCLINQREVHIHTTGFKRALRAALREDPDIILVGEMRDIETVSIALETAETGHLVFGTLHTTSAVSTIDRLIDQFPPGQQDQIRVMLADTLKGVIAQVLCKKIGGGRVAAQEILLGMPAVSNLIREGKTFQIPSIMQTGKKFGMRMLNDSLLEFVKSKTVEPEEAYAKSLDKSAFLSSLKSAGISTQFAEAPSGRTAPRRQAA